MDDTSRVARTPNPYRVFGRLKHLNLDQPASHYLSDAVDVCNSKEPCPVRFQPFPVHFQSSRPVVIPVKQRLVRDGTGGSSA